MNRRLRTLFVFALALLWTADALAAPPQHDDEVVPAEAELDAQTLRALLDAGELDLETLQTLVEAGDVDAEIAAAALGEPDGEIVVDDATEAVPAANREAQASAEAQALAEQQAAAEHQALAEQGVSEDGEVTDPSVYAGFIRNIVSSKREAIEDKVLDRVMEKQVARMGIISTIFSVVSALGLGLLFMPLVLRKRFPNKTATLWKYSALSALLFFITINLFAGVLSVLRFGQMAAGGMTNPQVQIVSATFDVIEEKAEDMAPMGPILIEPTLQAMSPDSEDPLPVLLLDNVAKFNNELTVFKAVGKFFKRVNWIFGYLPVVLSLVTVAVFLIGLRPTLEAIVRLPIRAASGEQGVARQTMGQTLRTVGRELLVTLSIMLVLMTVMIVAGLFLSEVLSPALEAFIAYLGVAFIYVQVVPDASTGAVLTALGGTVLFLVLDLAVVLVAAGLFIGKAHKIFQRRFHDKERLGAHARFWKWGTASLVYALAFPLLFIHAAGPIVELLIEWQTSGDDPNLAALLITGPVLLVVMFVGALALFRVHRAIAFLARTKVPKVGTPLQTGNGVPPVRTGMTARHDAVAFDSDAEPAWAPDPLPPVEASPEVPVRTGLTQAHPSLRPPPPKTMRYRAVHDDDVGR